MKLLFTFLFLGLATLGLSYSSQADDATGHVTITYSPRIGGGGVAETDLRQVGNQILGQSSFGMRMINLTVNNGSYTGIVGSSPTHLLCNATNCSGFINGQSAELNSKTKVKAGKSVVETSGSINYQSYTEDNGANSLSISVWNSMNLQKGADGGYTGEMTVGMKTYDVSVALDGSMVNFMNDPALVAIFLGAPIAHH